MLKFKKIRIDILNNPSIPFQLSDFFNSLFRLFIWGDNAVYEEKNEKTLSKNGILLSSTLQGIRVFKMDSHDKLNEIEKVLFYMLLMDALMRDSLPINTQKIDSTIEKILQTNRFCANPDIEIINIKDVIERFVKIKPNFYQQVILDFLTQLRDLIADEIDLKPILLRESVISNDNSAEPKSLISEGENKLINFIEKSTKTDNQHWITELVCKELSDNKETYETIKDDFVIDIIEDLFVLNRFYLGRHSVSLSDEIFQDEIKGQWELNDSELLELSLSRKQKLIKITHLSLEDKKKIKFLADSLDKNDSSNAQTLDSYLEWCRDFFELESLNSKMKNSIAQAELLEKKTSEEFRLICRAKFFRQFLEFLKARVQPQTKKENAPPEIKKGTQFYLMIYVLGKMGIVEEFPMDGTSTDEVKEKVSKAAIEGMKIPNAGTKYKIQVIVDYLRNKRIKPFANKDIVKKFLVFHYPDREAEISAILQNPPSSNKR